MATYYMDYENGNDSTTNTPLGWWSVAYTNGNDNGAAEPAEDEQVTGDTSGSTANVTVVVTDSGTWAGGDAAGTIYFYGKSAAFQSETVSASGGADFDIGGDFTYCAWRTMKTGATAARIAAGDIIRIHKSDDSTSIGNGTWTDVPATLPSGKNISSSTNASPININDTGHGFVTGDIVYIYNHATNFTANGTWTVTRVDDDNYTLDGSTGIAVGSGGTAYEVSHKTVKLASAATKSICICEDTWTAANGATVTRDTNQYKAGDASVKVVKSSPANDTLYAYFQIGGGAGVDFSSYQNVTFWLQNATAILANDWELCLCSDTAGATVVDTIAIPAIPSTNEWVVLNIAGDNANLGASIQSVALYSGSSAASTSGIYLDNIHAATTSGLNLRSLISKNSSQQGGTGGFYGIQSISEDGKLLRLDNHTDREPTDKLASNGEGYSGTTETVTTYKREPIRTDMQSSTTATTNEVMDDGTLGNNIQYQGGYNNADNTQDGETFFDGQNGNGAGINTGGENYITINYLNICRYNFGFYVTSDYVTFTNISNSTNNTSSGIDVRGSGNIFTKIRNASNNGTVGIYLTEAHNIFTSIDNVSNNSVQGIDIDSGSCFNTFDSITLISNNGNYGVEFTAAHNNTISSATFKKNQGAGLRFTDCAENRIYSSTFEDNRTDGILTDASQNYLIGCTISESTEVNTTNFGNFVYSQNHDATAENHKIFGEGMLIESDDGADRHTASGIAWKMSITDSDRNIYMPVNLKVAKILCVADKLVTVNIWMKKSHATNIVGKLLCRGGQIAGVASDVTDTKADDTSYEELEITFTPTEDGVVEIEAQCYYNGANANIWVDDMTITQAS